VLEADFSLPSNAKVKNAWSYIFMVRYLVKHDDNFTFAHLILLDLMTQILKLLIMQSSPASCHFLHLMSKYSPHHPVLNTLNLCSPLSVRPSLTPIQNNR
jgi:hypothetical protein